MENIDSIVIELSEKIIWLEKLYNQTLSNINENIGLAWMILIGILSIVSAGLVYMAKAMVKAGIDEGLREIKQDYDIKFREQQDQIDSLKVESGTNENGRYIRYPDGTQTSWKTVILPYDSGHTLMSMVAFPAFFVGEDIAVNISLIGDTVSEASERILTYERLNGGSVLVKLVKGSGNSFVPTETAEVSLFAIGRWK